MILKATIPGKLPSMNEIVAASKKHHMAYSTMKKENTELVMWYVKKLPKIERADITITWICKDKRKDKDNIIAGQKFIFDGLMKAGVFGNDGWTQIGDITHKFGIDKKNPRIEIEMQVEELF